MKKRLFTATAVITLLVMNACSKGGNDSGGTSGGGSSNVDCSGVAVSFKSDIQPLIASTCAISGCHNGTQAPNLTTYELIASNAAAIKNETQSGRMPKNGTLTAQQKKLIACWVQSGAPNN